MVFVLSLVYPVGLCMTALFNQYAGMPVGVEVLNITGAFMGILAGSTIAIIAGTQRQRLLLPSWLGPASVALGAVGIFTGIVFFAISFGPLGFRERASIYPLILWQIRGRAGPAPGVQRLEDGLMRASRLRSAPTRKEQT